MRMLAKFVHGSYLYKLNTPESDQDFKGIYMPSLKDMMLGKVKDSVDLSTNKSNEKNNSEDTDYEVYSIQKFVQLLSKGEMVTFDMLFAPEEAVTYYDEFGNMITSELAEEVRHPIYRLRNEFYDLFIHKDMKAYFGYCRRQAAKYGVKGSRLDSLYEVNKCIPSHVSVGGYWIELHLSNVNLWFIKEQLPKNEYLKKEQDHYEVLGKKHQWNTSLIEFNNRIQSEISKYGNRANLARNNEGIDWKAVSHAFRAGLQLESALINGRMQVVLPDEDRELILSIKKGELDWLSEVKPALEELMDRVELVAQQSTLPDKPDIENIECVLFNLISEYHQHNKEFSNVTS